jgi:hypothetical protein
MKQKIHRKSICKEKLKIGEVVRIDDYKVEEDNYYLVIGETHNGPDMDDNYYTLMNIKTNHIKTEPINIFLNYTICEAKIEIID